MKRSELTARIILIVFCLGAVAIPLGIFYSSRQEVLHARMAENGGWDPQVLHAQVGEPLHLKITSDDVMHSFAVGQMDMDPVDIEPGKVSEITVTFDKPGTYTFYCTRWCGANHWRMRGTIEVSGEEAQPETAEAPLYAKLGLDIDSAHPAAAIPSQVPDASKVNESTPGFASLDQVLSTAYYRSHSPAEAFKALGTSALSDPQKWNLVAYAWKANSTPEEIEEGARIFQKNCAACHGVNGDGEGVFADELEAAGEAAMEGMTGAQDMAMQKPANLADRESIMGASPAMLQGKILRGGMGTGMPMWGSILTEEQTWDVVAYIFSLHFRY